jgi:uncharacterized protein YegP (UPF0339 family)
MGAARFQVRRNKLTRRYRVVVLGRNNEVLTTSETLNSVAAVNKNIQATIDAASNAKRIDWQD